MSFLSPSYVSNADYVLQQKLDYRSDVCIYCYCLSDNLYIILMTVFFLLLTASNYVFCLNFVCLLFDFVKKFYLMIFECFVK